MSLGAEIRRLAELNGLTTQQEIADAAGLSQSHVGRILSGERPNLSADVLYKLSDALGVTCDHWRPFLAQPPEAKKPPSKKK